MSCISRVRRNSMRWKRNWPWSRRGTQRWTRYGVSGPDGRNARGGRLRHLARGRHLARRDIGHRAFPPCSCRSPSRPKTIRPPTPRPTWQAARRSCSATTSSTRPSFAEKLFSLVDDASLRAACTRRRRVSRPRTPRPTWRMLCAASRMPAKPSTMLRSISSKEET